MSRSLTRWGWPSFLSIARIFEILTVLVVEGILLASPRLGELLLCQFLPLQLLQILFGDGLDDRVGLAVVGHDTGSFVFRAWAQPGFTMCENVISWPTGMCYFPHRGAGPRV